MSEQCVKISIPLKGGETVSEKDVLGMKELGALMASSIEKNAVGEYDGDEFGGGVCTHYLYGPDADAIYRVISNAISNAPLAKGASIIVRYGPPGSKENTYIID